MADESMSSTNPDVIDARPGSRPSSKPELGPFAARLKLITDGMGIAEISQATGVDRRSIEGYLAAHHFPGMKKLLKLAEGLKVRVDWLAKGDGLPRPFEEAGPMAQRKMQVLGIMPRPGVAEAATPAFGPDHRATADVNARRAGAEQGDAGQSLPAGFVLVPRFCLKAAAARGRLDEAEDLIEHYAYQVAWLRQDLKVEPDRLCVLDQVGNSMAPDIVEGESILVDRATERFVGDGVYWVAFEGNLAIKQLQRVDGGRLRLVSRNEDYEPQTVNDRDDLIGVDFRILGRVLGKPSFTKL